MDQHCFDVCADWNSDLQGNRCQVDLIKAFDGDDEDLERKIRQNGYTSDSNGFQNKLCYLDICKGLFQSRITTIKARIGIALSSYNVKLLFRVNV